MKSVKALLTLVLLFMLCSNKNALAEPQKNKDITGSWEGALSVQGQSIPLVFNINSDLTATMDSPAQGATNIPIESVTVDGLEVNINIAAAGASFIGRLTLANNEIKGHWLQGPNKLPLSLKKAGKKISSVVKRPQHPLLPYEYVVKEVKFKNQEQNVELAGTLTLPSSTGKYPAVVLISGSGPQDRDQTVMGHKTFLVLADFLTKKGIAVLRFDDRGVGDSTGNFAAATSADFASDVSAAVNYLSSHANVAKENIGLIGHSEGGLIAPIAATTSPNVSFIALLAGPGQNGNEIAVWQVKTILKATGLSEEAANAGSNMTRALNEVVMMNSDSTTLTSKLMSTYERNWQALPENVKSEIKKIGGGKLSQARIKELTSNWTKFFLAHNPAAYLGKLQIPVLAIHGAKDTQMDAKQNLKKISDALHEHPLHRVEEIAGVNHLFQRANTGFMTEYAKIEETMSPKVLEIIGDWVLKVTVEKQ
ncbi:alpha/beta hydrolase family protein [Alteromonas gracilis]|uniref:alpha/beta hydrolase family protein n=1 Tax=Alteromonas gracilis TaxID=1479524 RepID=UPI00321A59BF